MRHWSAAQVRARISVTDAAEAIRDALLREGKDDFEQPLRVSLGGGRVLVMPARQHSSGDAVIKILRVNSRDGKPPASGNTIDGVVMWLDGEGRPIWTADAAALTLVRTAALVSLGTQALAPANAERLTIMGAGHQSDGMYTAVAAVRPVREVTIWNRSVIAADALAERLTAQTPGLQVRIEADPDRAVRDAQVICCATASPEPLFAASALADDVHVNAIGSYRAAMHELSTAVMAKASVVAVDDAAACCVESGEIVDAVAAGVIDPGSLVELPDLLRGAVQRSGLTIFKSVGMAVADLAVTRLLAEV